MINKRAGVLALSIALAACGKGGGEPQGQVVATVDGQEITTTDLDAELAGASASSPEQQKAMQAAALQNIVSRKLLAKAAVDQGLDKGPKAAVLEQKAKDLALIELLNEKARSAIPAASDEEVRSFVDSNPAMFANHQTLLVDQLIVPQADRALLQALQPVKSLEEAQRILAANKRPFNSTSGVIDTLSLPPEAAKQITSLPADEVFIIPAGQGLRLNHVRSSQHSPLMGPQAIQIAREILTKQRVQGQLNNELGKIVNDGQAKVKYNAAFKPKTPPTQMVQPVPRSSAAGTQ